MPDHDHDHDQHHSTDDNQHGCADYDRSNAIKHYHAQHIHHAADPDNGFPDDIDYDIIVLHNDGPPCDDDNCLGDDHDKYYVFNDDEYHNLLNDLHNYYNSPAR